MGSLYEGSKTETRALSALINLVRSAESVMGRLKRQFAGLAITQSQFSALDVLIHLGPLSQRELGEKLFKTSGNITMVVEKKILRPLTSSISKSSISKSPRTL